MPVLRGFPTLNVPQAIEKINIRLAKNDNENDLIFEINPEINEKDVMKICATEPISNGRAHPNDNQYRIIKIADQNFKSGSSIKESYLKVHGRLPEYLEKIVFIVGAMCTESCLSTSSEEIHVVNHQRK